MKRLFTCGDSHSYYGWKDLKIDNCEIIVQERDENSPSTCSAFGINKLSKVNIKDYGVKDGDIIVFCFGETDCRYIFMNNSAWETDLTINFKDLMDKIIDNYFVAIKENADQFKDLVVIVSCLPPMCKVSPPPSQYRRNLHEYFNGKIHEKCKEYNYIALDTYASYIDKDGTLARQFSDGYVHIIDMTAIKEELLRLFNEHNIIL